MGQFSMQIWAFSGSVLSANQQPVPDYAQKLEKPCEANFSPAHTFVLSQREAEAASPEDFAVCGEEDPGEGLEFLVADETKDGEK